MRPFACPRCGREHVTFDSACVYCSHAERREREVGMAAGLKIGLIGSAMVAFLFIVLMAVERPVMYLIRAMFSQ